VALRTFGGKGKGNAGRCKVVLAQPLAPLQRAELLDRIKAAKRTKTPLAASIRAAATDVGPEAGVAITVAFVASLAATLGWFGVEVWWELATLIAIMLTLSRVLPIARTRPGARPPPSPCTRARRRPDRPCSPCRAGLRR
jgi:hypothetical protein